MTSFLLDEDLSYVVARIPKDVRKLMREEGAIVAGGYIRSQIAQEKPSDIDLFGPDILTLKKWATDLALQRKGELHTTDNAYTVLAPPRIPVQFIYRWKYKANLKIGAEETPKQMVHELLTRVIADFDFSIAQAAIAWVPATEEESKGEYISVISDRFYADLAGHRLVYTEPDREEKAGGSMMRVRKFLKAGYRISAGNLARVLFRIVDAIDFERLEKAAHNADETVPEMTKKVMTGLLREVDPLIVVDGVDLVPEEQSIPDDLLAEVRRQPEIRSE